MNKLILQDDVRRREYTYSGPSKWNDLSEAQLLAWAALCLKKMPFDHLVKAAFIFLYSIPAKLFFRVPNSQIVQFADKLNFLLNKNELSKWVIQKIRFRRVTYYGPSNQLTNITIGEFRRLEIYWQAYVKLKEAKKPANEYLYLLFATLYRPKRKGLINDDLREDLTEYSIHERVKRLKGFTFCKIRFGAIEPKYLEATLLNYEGCRNYIIQAFKPIFEKKEGNGPGKNELFDFIEVIDSVAGSTFGDAEKTEHTNLYRFLKHLVRQKQAYDELKSKQK